MAFNLRARVVRSFQDVQQNFDQIAGLLGGGVLQLAVAVASGRKVAFGSQPLTWPGGAFNSNAATVSHGLGVTPAAVLATVGEVSGLNVAPVVRVHTVGSSSFDVYVATADAQNPLVTATSAVYWLAIG